MLVFLKQFGHPLFGAKAHRTDFEHFEFASVLANARLREKDRAAILQLDEQRDHRQQRRCQQQKNQRHADVQRPFGDVGAVGEPLGAQPLLLHVGIEPAADQGISGCRATAQQQQGDVVVFHKQAAFASTPM